MTPERLKEIEKRVKCICPKWCLETPSKDMGGHNWDDCHRYCPNHGEGFFQKREQAELVTALRRAWKAMEEVEGEVNAHLDARHLRMRDDAVMVGRENLEKLAEKLKEGGGG